MTEFDPVPFDKEIVEKVEKAAKAHGLSVKRITSGAGQDAQMLARLCPTAMIFVPSVKGISHNPEDIQRMRMYWQVQMYFRCCNGHGAGEMI